MNIITSNCLGGFIYRDVLNQEYQNPFIWTKFLNNEMFIDFVDNFKNINFDNVMIEKEGDGLTNNFITVIDDKYFLKNSHIYFSILDSVPRIDNRVYCNTYYNRPWEYILEKYEKRLKRMTMENIVICLYELTFTEEQILKLIDVCKNHNYKCLIFAQNKIESDYAKILYFRHNKDPWNIEMFEKYKNNIKVFLQ